MNSDCPISVDWLWFLASGIDSRLCKLCRILQSWWAQQTCLWLATLINAAKPPCKNITSLRAQTQIQVNLYLKGFFLSTIWLPLLQVVFRCIQIVLQRPKCVYYLHNRHCHKAPLKLPPCHNDKLSVWHTDWGLFYESISKDRKMTAKTYDLQQKRVLFVKLCCHGDKKMNCLWRKRLQKIIN